MSERNHAASRRIARAVRSMHDAVADGIAPEHLVRDRSTVVVWDQDTPRSIIEGTRSR
jgi:hypothetical protein